MQLFDQFANVVLPVAAALSMASWVTRTPDNPQNFPANFNDPYNNVQNHRYHPYGQTQPNDWAESFNNQNYGPMVQQQTFVPNNFQSYGRNELYQSKEAEETFRAYMELQELISWQESYRRGDLPIGQTNNEQFVLPVAQNNKPRESSSLDDGYATGSSVASPASSTVSGLASEVDEISATSSPLPDSVFDGLETFNTDSPFSQINQRINTFDIDQILDNDDKDYSPANTPFSCQDEEDEEAKAPFSKLISALDYVADSPLKSPGADWFLAGQSPEYNPPHTVNNNKFDPFQMQFTNSSMAEKFSDISDFDPSFFENSGQTDEDMDRALVQSLSQKNGVATVSIKIEDDYSMAGSPMVEHDYSKEGSISAKTDFVNNQKQDVAQFKDFAQPSPNFMQRPSSSPSASSTASPIPQGRRTFAPESTQKQQNKAPKKKLKEPKSARILWPDFPYSTDQIINMAVEKFNEVIKPLDEIRQHVAKDVRRKGKNKLAARNCRKRKMEIIDHLDTGISHMELQRRTLLAERQRIIDETRQIQQKTEWLNNYIFEHLRDDNGRPYSTNDFSLQYTADGNVYLVPSVPGQP